MSCQITINSLKSGSFKSCSSLNTLQAEGHPFHSKLASSKKTKKPQSFKLQLSKKDIKDPWPSGIHVQLQILSLEEKHNLKKLYVASFTFAQKKKNHTVLEFENTTVTSFQVTSSMYCYYCKTWFWDYICTFRILIPKLQTLKFGKPSNYHQLPQQMDWKNTLNQSTWKIIWYHFSHGSYIYTQTAAPASADTTFITERMHTISQIMPF